MTGKTGEGNKPKPMHRKKAMQWLLAHKRMLRLHGVPLERFLQHDAPNQRPPPED